VPDFPAKKKFCATHTDGGGVFAPAFEEYCPTKGEARTKVSEIGPRMNFCLAQPPDWVVLLPPQRMVRRGPKVRRNMMTYAHNLYESVGLRFSSPPAMNAP
jgi:hypothetical protein